MSEITYECEVCGIKSTVTLEDGDTLISATLKINADHRKHSPACKGWEVDLKILSTN